MTRTLNGYGKLTAAQETRSKVKKNYVNYTTLIEYDHRVSQLTGRNPQKQDNDINMGYLSTNNQKLSTIWQKPNKEEDIKNIDAKNNYKNIHKTYKYIFSYLTNSRVGPVTYTNKTSAITPNEIKSRIVNYPFLGIKTDGSKLNFKNNN